MRSTSPRRRVMLRKSFMLRAQTPPEIDHWDNRTSPRQGLALKGSCSSSIDRDGLHTAKQAKCGSGEDYVWLDDETLGTNCTQRARRGNSWEEKAEWTQVWVEEVTLNTFIDGEITVN